MDMDGASMALDLMLGGGIGLILGLTGMGGGLLAVPALVVVARLPLSTAVGTAGVYLIASQFQAMLAHHWLGHVQWKTARTVLIGAVPAALVVAVILHVLPAGNAGFQYGLRALIVVAIGVALVLVARTPDQNAVSTSDTSPLTPATQHPLIGLLFSSLVGGLIGATAVGGGVLIVPLLMSCFGLGATAAVGTSAAVALVLFLVISLPAALAGSVVWTTAGLLIGGSLLGVHLGVRLATRLPARWLRYLLLAVMALAGIAMAMPLMP